MLVPLLSVLAQQIRALHRYLRHVARGVFDQRGLVLPLRVHLQRHRVRQKRVIMRRMQKLVVVRRRQKLVVIQEAVRDRVGRGADTMRPSRNGGLISMTII